MNRNNFRMDRTVFASGKMNEESEQHDYSSLSEKEGLQVATYLISVAYGFVGKPWPKMDRTKFEIVKRGL